MSTETEVKVGTEAEKAANIINNECQRVILEWAVGGKITPSAEKASEVIQRAIDTEVAKALFSAGQRTGELEIENSATTARAAHLASLWRRHLDYDKCNMLDRFRMEVEQAIYGS